MSNLRTMCGQLMTLVNEEQVLKSNIVLLTVQWGDNQNGIFEFAVKEISFSAVNFDSLPRAKKLVFYYEIFVATSSLC